MKAKGKYHPEGLGYLPVGAELIVGKGLATAGEGMSESVI
jgi:hypothetical protein